MKTETLLLNNKIWKLVSWKNILIAKLIVDDVPTAEDLING